jgi:hypothetical protein
VRRPFLGLANRRYKLGKSAQHLLNCSYVGGYYFRGAAFESKRKIENCCAAGMVGYDFYAR